MKTSLRVFTENVIKSKEIEKDKLHKLFSKKTKEKINKKRMIFKL